MKLKKIIENVLLTFFFLVVIAYPWVATFLGVENNLSGAEEKVEFSFENIDDYIIQNFPGRELLVRTKNQLLYSLFDISPNTSITKVGDTLFSTETLNYFYHGLHSVNNAEIDSLIEKLSKFNDICNEKGKKLLVVLTPTKPRYYNGTLPFADDVIMLYEGNESNNDYENMLPYDKLSIALKNTKLNYFDSINYIDSHSKNIIGGKVPLFYNSSHHWSVYKANLIGLALHEHLRKTMDIKLPKIEITASPSDVAIYPDADLFNILNIYDKPNEQFYESVIDYKDFDNDNLNFTIQGGSFLGGLLFPQSTISVFGSVYHIENKNLFYNNYKDHCPFETYDELNEKFDLIKHLQKTDVFILEINELNVYNATFGFIDYLLAHEEEI